MKIELTVIGIFTGDTKNEKIIHLTNGKDEWEEDIAGWSFNINMSKSNAPHNCYVHKDGRVAK